jgi:hypothetical protein
MRRRLWWHILMHDGRAAEDHGIAVNNFDPATDTRIPLEVDDSALDPAMTELPVPAAGRHTEMTMACLLFETYRTVQTLYRMLSASGFTDPRAPNGESARQEIMARLKARMQSRLENCNPVIPIQRVTSLVIQSMVAKIDFVSRQQWRHLDGDGPDAPKAGFSEANLVNACEILEMYIDLQADQLVSNYSWMGEIYPQYHVILYCLWHLSTKPLGPTVERAWKAVDGAFALEEARKERQALSAADSGPKWGVMRAFRAKALRIRESIQSNVAASGEVASVDDMVVDTEAFGWDKSFEDKLESGWETGYLDWDGLVSGLQGNDHEAPGTG